MNTFGTDPLNTDTDAGGVPDGEEVERGTDPLNPEDDHDAGEPIDTGSVKGGGGCDCATSEAPPAGLGAALAALLAAVGLSRRRR